MARLIDSSVFIELERRGLPLAVIATDALDEPNAIASITAAELLFGVERANTRERRDQRTGFVEAVLAEMPIVPLDLVVARAQARLWAELATSGSPIGPYDLVVAATALVEGYDVLTFNVREFQRVPGLVVRRPAW